MGVCSCMLAGTRHCLTCSNYSPLKGEIDKMNFQEWRDLQEDMVKYKTYTSTHLKENEKYYKDKRRVVTRSFTTTSL